MAPLKLSRPLTCITENVPTPNKSSASSSTKLSHRRSGFTLTEVLVATAVLALVILFVIQLMQGATRIMTAGHKRIDADSQAQQVFDRMATDFNQMIKRTDVNYYFKATTPSMPGNDQIAFFTNVPGHYPQSTYNSGTSLVAYRINANSGVTSTISYNRLERMGKGLLLNGGSNSYVPLLFLDASYTTTIINVWPTAASNTAIDTDYALAGPRVFRFEYYYLLNPSGPSGLSGLSAGPWANSTTAFQIKDISAVVVALAVIDPKSRSILSTSQLELLAGTNGQTSPFVDFATGWTAGELLSNWQTALATNSQLVALPLQARQNIRFYERYLPLPR